MVFNKLHDFISEAILIHDNIFYTMLKNNEISGGLRVCKSLFIYLNTLDFIFLTTEMLMKLEVKPWLLYFKYSLVSLRPWGTRCVRNEALAGREMPQVQKAWLPSSFVMELILGCATRFLIIILQAVSSDKKVLNEDRYSGIIPSNLSITHPIKSVFRTKTIFTKLI
jgi:hypothetical protein